MPRSFIDRSKLNEYFGGTFVKLGDEIVKVREFVFDENVDGVDSCYFYYRSRTGNDREIFDGATTYDEVISRFTPYLPETQYMTSQDGGDFLLSYTTQGHYKRSMDMSRYFIVRNIDNYIVHGGPGSRIQPSDFNVPSRTLEEAMSMTVRPTSVFCALNSHFALLRVSRRRTPTILLLYKDVPIGVVNNWGVVKLHSKYVPHLKDKVSSFMEVANG